MDAEHRHGVDGPGGDDSGRYGLPGPRSIFLDSLTLGENPGRAGSEAHTRTVEPPVARQGRRILEVTFDCVLALKRNGALPMLPLEIDLERITAKSRMPTEAEMAGVKWLLEVGPRPLVAVDTTIAPEIWPVTGVLGYRVIYDHHTGRDMVDVIHLAGSKRGCIALALRAAEVADSLGAIVGGEVPILNKPMIALYRRLGCQPARVRMERR